jgi:hypothetical protein
MKVYVLRLVVWLPNEVTKAYKTIFSTTLKKTRHLSSRKVCHFLIDQK